jgi:hypothetical protein
MRLYCGKCKRNTQQKVLPWQTEAHVFGGVSITCEKCNTLKVLLIKDGKEVKL